MREPLTATEYEFTKSKLHMLETRLAEIEARTDLSPSRLASARRSYRDIIGQLRREMAEYEAIQKLETAELVAT